MESSVETLVELLNETAGSLQPAVLPSNLRIRECADLCTTEEHTRHLEAFIAKRGITGALLLVTKVDFGQRTVKLSLRVGDAVEQQLTNLDRMLKLLVVGGEEELQIIKSRFLYEKGYDEGAVREMGGPFEQTYNLAQSLKMLLNNTPGLVVEFGGEPLPLAVGTDLKGLLGKVEVAGADGKARKGNGKRRAGAGDEDEDKDGGGDDDDEEEEEEEQQSAKKSKKKRKRGSGKGSK
jgi:hypothetical protein